MDGIGGSHSLRDLLRHVLHEHRIGRQFEVRGENVVRGRSFSNSPSAAATAASKRDCSAGRSPDGTTRPEGA